MLFGIRMSNQPFQKRLDQNTTQIKVRTHNKVLVQPFPKRLCFGLHLFSKGVFLVQPFLKRLVLT
jgi:hypothetical protein